MGRGEREREGAGFVRVRSRSFFDGGAVASDLFKSTDLCFSYGVLLGLFGGSFCC
jgi:hypothetical protein